ncbi:MAG TPA: hypothetical protein K8W06_04535 [Limosilactobacillus coleohominis]|nr:hypothetical protein [Limosilactobacillus coleohominis]
MSKTSEAKLKANKKWTEKNKDKQRVYLYRSHAKKFIRDIATEDDLKELRKMIDEKLNSN